MLLDAGGDREDVGVEDDVLGGEADLVDEDVVGALRRSPCGARRLSAWPSSSKAMTTIAAPYLRHSRACSMKGSTPSFIEIELTIGLPWTHLRPASMTSHLRGVDHQRHPGDVGLAGDQLDEAVHRRDAVDHPLVHVDVDDLRAGLDLLARRR